jgi:polysaccharide export outer membrane protein
VRAYGQTIEELHKELNAAYAESGLPELEVTVQILSVAPRKVYVMGEVRSPGVQSVDNMVTLTQALSMAGGITPRGDTHKVLVVRRKGLPMPQGTVIDMEEILENSTVEVGDAKDRQRLIDTKKWAKDFWLDDYDLVYVPRTDLARGNDWIEQVFTKGIWAIMPFSTSLGMNFGYQVYNAPSSYGTNDTTRWSNMANSVWND